MAPTALPAGVGVSRSGAAIGYEVMAVMSCTCSICGSYRWSIDAPGTCGLWPFASSALMAAGCFPTRVALSGRPAERSTSASRCSTGQGLRRYRDVALFRYSLIQEAADPSLVSAERGRLVRALAARDHTGPSGERVRLARNSIDRWIRAWRAGGCEALVLRTQAAKPTPQAAVRDLAVRLKRETPGCPRLRWPGSSPLRRGGTRRPPCRLSGHPCLRDRRGSRRPTR